MTFRVKPALVKGLTGSGLLFTAIGCGALGWQAALGTLRVDIASGAIAVVAVGGLYALMIARQLTRFWVEVTPKGLGVGPSAVGAAGLLPWEEIDRLDRYVGKGSTIYKVKAGSREVAFSSQLFTGHADLASMIAEHTGRSWEVVDGPSPQPPRRNY